MKKLISIFGFTFFLFTGMIMSSCSDGIPVYESYEYQGPTENGNLKVYARQNNIYFTGALVKLYLSDTERDNDQPYITTLTEDHGPHPSDQFAIIMDLDPQTYYLQVTTDYSGSKITGREDSDNGIYVPKGVISTVHVFMQ